MATTNATKDNVDAQLASIDGDLQRLHGNYRSSWTRTLGHMGAVHVAQQRQEQDFGAMALLETHSAWHARSMRDSQEAHHATVKLFVDAVDLANGAGGGGASVNLPDVQVDEVIDDPAPAPGAAPALTLTEAPVAAAVGEVVALAPVIHDTDASVSSVTGHVDDTTRAELIRSLKTPLNFRWPTITIEGGAVEHNTKGDKDNHDVDDDDLDRASTVAQAPQPRGKTSIAVQKLAEITPVINMTTSNVCWAYSNGRCNDIVCPRGLYHACITCYKRKKAYNHPWCMGAGQH
ncbi:uncharacterized protein LOC62_03G004352 [Vanrija pseudolonga]|uniref:Uncharacterized protein n=1 Tax=Vanrija pseudolonga TaxID=143232 RepID=A0AAF0Y9V3_9TREE|nr:hypothetical protein LOC62_03G004352 [Vanrija pseudolonga]